MLRDRKWSPRVTKSRVQIERGLGFTHRLQAASTPSVVDWTRYPSPIDTLFVCIIIFHSENSLSLTNRDRVEEMKDP